MLEKIVKKNKEVQLLKENIFIQSLVSVHLQQLNFTHQFISNKEAKYLL